MIHNNCMLNRKEVSSYIIGSSLSGILEIMLFHPIDTISKRLMSNTSQSYCKNTSLRQNIKAVNKVVFGEAQNYNFIHRWLFLFSGISFAASYKVLQRTYKYTTQPIFKNILEKNFEENFINTFGEKWGNVMFHATSGS